MCFYCSNKEGTIQTTGTSINDNEWWQEYLKKSQTGKPVDDNPCFTTSATEMGQNLAELLRNAIGGLFND